MFGRERDRGIRSNKARVGKRSGGEVELLEDRKGGRRMNRVLSLEENTRWRRRKERWLEREY